MAGEWIAYDITLPEKPEVQELLDTTGEPVEVVVFRLLRLWGWASMHCADGTARMTVPRLVRTCGGDDAFWMAVQAVGWLEIDEAAETVAVPGWDRRFSCSAKARIQESDRKRAYEDRNPGRKRTFAPSDGGASDGPTAASRRGEEKRIPPPPREGVEESEAAAGWGALRPAWSAGPGKAWKPAAPPPELAARLAEQGWLAEALEAIPRLRGCRYFETPVTLTQFCGAGFVQRVLGGQYDAPKTTKRPAEPGERPPAQGWGGDDAARLEATKRKLAEQLRAEAGA